MRRIRLTIFGYFTTFNVECVSPHYLIKEEKQRIQKMVNVRFFS